MSALVQLTPTVWRVPFAVVNAYVVRTTEGVALVDTGPVDVHDEILQAVAAIGATCADVHWIVLTHCHKDHAGSAAALAHLTGGKILAGAADAPVIAGVAPEPEAVITPEERPFYDQATRAVPPAPHVQVDQVLTDGDRLDWGLPNAVILETPGHTPGSIAVHLPDARLLFTGDNIASLGAKPILGPFNVARHEAIRSFEKLAQLDIDIACFGHGDPIVTNAASELRSVVRMLT